MLSIDRKVVNDEIASFNIGIMMLFGSFFVFNLQYATGAECTLEFIQRYEYFSIILVKCKVMFYVIQKITEVCQ